MNLLDKFKIIEYDIKDENINDKLDNYFENFILSDLHIKMPDYINQILYFNKIDKIILNNNIVTYITKLLFQTRLNIRNAIKKEKFELASLIIFSKKFIKKLEYINNIVNSDKLFIKFGLEELSKFIISDSFILLFFEEEILNNFLEWQTTKIYNNKSVKSLLEITKKLNKYDYNDIHIKLISAIGNTFKKKCINLIELPLPNNIKKIQLLHNNIEIYNDINKYFSFIDKENVKNINSNIIELIIENFIDILNNNNIDDIEFIFNNYSEFLSAITIVSKNFIIAIVNMFKRHTINISGENIIKILNIYDIFMIFFWTFPDKSLITIMIQKIFNIESNIDTIFQHINILFCSYDKSGLNIIKLLCSFLEIDFIANRYYELLIKRLMDNIMLNSFQEYINFEMKIATFLEDIFSRKLIYKINKIIHDTLISFSNNIKYKLSNNLPISVITTSYDNWNINQIDGLLNKQIISYMKNSKIAEFLVDYQTFYEKEYKNKLNLIWFPHYGEVTIEYMDQSFKMLPIQFMVLEMFTVINKVTLIDIYNAPFFNNYAQQFKENIISSFISAKLCKIDNKNLILETQGIFKTDLINIFFTVSDYIQIFKQKSEENLAHSRDDIVVTNINHLLKKNKMNYNELYNACNENIKTFTLTTDIFLKALVKMIKMEYILLNNNDIYEKLYY